MELATLTLYATGERLNGHEFVRVTAGGEDEQHWRSLGYMPEGEIDSEVAVESRWEAMSAPELRALAESEGVLDEIEGSGARGRVSKSDLVAFFSSREAGE